MKFLIISHVLHKSVENQWFAYAPYVREMNLWSKYIDELEIVAPSIVGKQTAIDIAYNHDNICFNAISEIQFTSFKKAISSMFKLPKIIVTLIKAFKRVDHIHLRCPGNIALLGCFVQIFFPKKIKTAKYAGNWDPKAKQPTSYKLQKWILSNTFLTKNMTVLVYGEWENQSKNIKSFFTASFKNSDIEEAEERNYSNTLKFVFVGSLVKGKRPEFSIKVVEALAQKGYNVTMQLFGDGVLKDCLLAYIKTRNLDSKITLEGNQPIEKIKEVLKTAHFLILPSKSEGWPKAIAEAMFFGVIPIATKISCVPKMLDNGNRGILIDPKENDAVIKIMDALRCKDLKMMSKLALDWSQTFTLEYFESEIKKLLLH